MAWDDDEVEIERSPFMALRGLLRPSSSTTNARRTDPLESVPGVGFQPKMPEPQPHKCTPGVKLGWSKKFVQPPSLGASCARYRMSLTILRVDWQPADPTATLAISFQPACRYRLRR